MKRKTKNIIIITLIIILGIASGFTVKLAKDSVSTNSENVGQNMGTPPGQGGPGQNDNNAGQNQSDNSMGQNQGTPPAKPDGSGDNSNMSEPPTMPNENNGNSMGEPPTKPDDSNGNSTSESPRMVVTMTRLKCQQDQVIITMECQQKTGKVKKSTLNIIFYLVLKLS